MSKANHLGPFSVLIRTMRAVVRTIYNVLTKAYVTLAGKLPHAFDLHLEGHVVSLENEELARHSQRRPVRSKWRIQCHLSVCFARNFI